MAVTTEHVANLLDKCDGIRKIAPVIENVLLAVITPPDGEPIPVMVVAKDSGMVQFRSANLAHAPGQAARKLVRRAMLQLNYANAPVKFACDESDGEIVAYVDLMVLDGALTNGQLTRIIDHFRTTVVAGRARCEAIVRTGQDAAAGLSGGTGGPASEDAELAFLLELMKSVMAEKDGKTDQPGAIRPPAPPPVPQPPPKPPTDKPKKGWGGVLDDPD